MGKDAKKRNTITVKEIKELAPLSEVYELNTYAKYLVTVAKPMLAHGDKTPYELAHARATAVAEALKAQGIPCIVLIGVTDDVKFLELKGEKQ